MVNGNDANVHDIHVLSVEEANGKYKKGHLIYGPLSIPLRLGKKLLKQVIRKFRAKPPTSKLQNYHLYILEA